MVVDFYNKEIAVGCEVVCLPQHNFRLLIPAEVVEMYDQYAMVRFNYPETIFNGREEVERCYYEDMVVIKQKKSYEHDVDVYNKPAPPSYFESIRAARDNMSSVGDNEYDT